ncbi:RNA-binding protein 5 [Ataeniobius toweri]|uniref:RNA-binding protein 5 n=1 Tax=Ataeniobius toweri TaxID=208326 RepID=A0ABU7A2C8_9TELE|nr:RNA-binding protein 5 [Ataeniobius toweri]
MLHNGKGSLKMALCGLFAPSEIYIDFAGVTSPLRTWVLIKGSVGLSVAVDMVQNSPVMIQTGETDGTEIKNVITTHGAGVKRGVIVMMETVEDHETVQSKERGNGGTVIDQKMVITQMIRFAIDQLEGPQPVDVRLMKKRTGISRGFAFVDFYHLQDATRWMETNQKRLVIQGKVVDMHYSHPRNKYEDWLCNTCGLYNFRRRLKCFRCGAAKVEGEASSVTGLPDLQPTGDFYGDTIILRNIAPLTTVEAILTALAPYANLSSNNIRLIKDKQTGQNRGFAFVQLSSPLEASQLLTILQGLQPPLKLDGKTIGVDYAKSARKDLLLPDGNRVSAFSVASTAIAAAQWSSAQPQQTSDGMSEYACLQEGYAPLSQDYQTYYQQGAAASTCQGNGILGAAPGVKLVPAAVVISQSPQVYQPHIIAQAAVQVISSVLMNSMKLEKITQSANNLNTNCSHCLLPNNWM